MPIYELRCESCGHEFEELVFRRSEVETLTCPQCGREYEAVQAVDGRVLRGELLGTVELEDDE